jgi:uncharacterized iron-regulated membrane protein
VIAFNHELDEWLNPALFRVRPDGTSLTPLELAAKVEAADPRVRVSYLPLRIERGSSLDVFVEPRVDPSTGEPYTVDYSQVFLDPVTGAMLGRRMWGACCLEREHVIPFLYKLHYSLHLRENVGLWVMGLVAIVWAFDSFVGLYLTLPRGRPFFRRWRVSWGVKRDAGAFRMNFDLHRAGGLWAWAVLLVLAVSGVALSLEEQVMRPVVSLFSPVTPDVFHQAEAELGGRLVEPRVTRERVIAEAADEARRRGWEQQLDGVFYASTAGLYGVGVGDHHAPGLGSPYLYFDAADGRLVAAVVPGEGTPGDRFLQLQFPLHTGQIAGLPTRILISVTGLVVAMLSITGVVIWLRKSRRRAERVPATRAVEQDLGSHL